MVCHTLCDCVTGFHIGIVFHFYLHISDSPCTRFVGKFLTQMLLYKSGVFINNSLLFLRAHG